MSRLLLSFDSGEDSLSVRRFLVEESLSTLFSVSIWAVSADSSLDLESLVGRPASFAATTGYVNALRGGGRRWGGLCSFMEQIQAESTGLSTYYLRIVPTLWKLTQRSNYRIFQHLSIPDIVDKLLSEWAIKPQWKIDRGAYPKLNYKVQYGESDYVFISRLLEEAGIAFTFEGGEAESTLVLGDALHSGEAWAPLRFVDNPNQSSENEFVTRVRLSNEVRPGAFAIRDHDMRNPSFALLGDAPKGVPPEDRYEQYSYRPGAFLVESDKGGDTPAADDKGTARHEQSVGKGLAERSLLGARMGKVKVTLSTNVLDLAPGVVFSVDGHPHTQLQSDRKLLLTSFTAEGSPEGEWMMGGSAVFTATPYRPRSATPKPKVVGVQSATVVGPDGQEIHTDEFGRVRVQFHWDREGKSDDDSSSWIRVSQGWAGTGYGMIAIPRVGQEVLVGFLDGDPDQPIIVGRTFNNSQRVPYDLPKHKTRSTWRSDSSPGSNGFNEIMFEDHKGRELFYVQAEKNLRKLVKNDETITVGNNRKKLVKANETETTDANRTEVTGQNRTEITVGNRLTVIGKNRRKLIKGSETERTEGNLTVLIGKDNDIVIKRDKRERVEQDSHLIVKGQERRRVDDSRSIVVGKNQEARVGRKHAVHAGKEIHLKSDGKVVIESARDLTLKGPGGFIRIDASGVTIRGTVVKINSGGSPGTGTGSAPVEPAEAIEAVIEEPEAPPTDDVSKTGLAQ